MFGKKEVFIDWKIEQLANVDHDFGLLDRINTEFTFQILIQFNKISRIPSMLDDHIDDLLCHCIIIDWSGIQWLYFCRNFLRNLWRWFFDRLLRFCLRNGNACFATLHSLNVSNHMIQGWVLRKNECFVNREIEMLSNVNHDFCLLDRINTEFTFQILVQFNEVRWVTGVFDDDINYSLDHISTRCYGCWSWNRCNHGSFYDRWLRLKRRHFYRSDFSR